MYFRTYDPFSKLSVQFAIPYDRQSLVTFILDHKEFSSQEENFKGAKKLIFFTVTGLF